MPNFSVNGIPASTTRGETVIETSSKKFTISWEGLDSATNYPVRFRVMLDSQDDLTNDAGTDWWLFYYTTEYYGSGNAGYNGYVYEVIGTSGSDVITSSVSLEGKTLEIVYSTTFEGGAYYVTFQKPDPSITVQPSITSIAPSSGTSTVITWTAAKVSNQGTATIYYEYAVGSSSTYNDAYYIGTTTELTAEITEETILDKCGNDFEGICYLFVLAYWEKTDGTTGERTDPTGMAFTYTPHSTLMYYTDRRYVECIPYLFYENRWVECIPYYHDGHKWVKSSH